MKAFHGSEEIKAKYVARLKAHHAADEIIQGTGWENGKGCAVGCTLHSFNFDAYPDELGLPAWIGRLEERIFEGLPAKEAKDFAVNFLDVIPVGADVEKVRWQLASLRHRRDRERFVGRTEPYIPELISALDQVIEYCESDEKNEDVRSAAESAWSAAVSAGSAAWSAWSAAGSVWSAWSAAVSAGSAAESAAWSAHSAGWSVTEPVWSAESAAESAAYSAWSAHSAGWSATGATTESAESAVRCHHYRWEAENLLRLLSEAPVIG